MAVNGIVTTTIFSSIGREVEKITLTELTTAITRLETLAPNVINCNCTPTNCCQSSYCQACQGCQTATCQSYTCQSYSCQSCQTCQR